MKNIILIGMSGCGKSTIAKALSKRLDIPWIDMDHYIENKYKQTIAEMFAIDESYFRECEKICCQEICKKEGYIIATGGGIIKDPENCRMLNKKGFVIYIDRSVTDILQDVEVKHRPLLKNGADVLYQMYKDRNPLYKETAHITILNQGTLVSVIDEIIRQIKEHNTSNQY